MIFGLYHDPKEYAGLISEVLVSEGYPFRQVRLFDGEGLPRDTSDLRGLIIMGGGLSVHDEAKFPYLIPELQLIEKVLLEKKPVLGVCLGSQLIAKALGANVYPAKKREIGWHPISMTREAASDPVFSQLPKSLPVLHWHGDTFDLPKGAVHLAKSTVCKNQAFKWGAAVYGLQFHLEATPAMVQSWLADPNGQSYAKGGGQSPEALIKKTREAYCKLEPHARSFIKSYLHHAFGPVQAAV